MSVLRRPPVILTMTLRRLAGQTLGAELRLPDEIGALTLKALATTVRTKDTDLVDLWRCLEVAAAAGVRPDMLTGKDEQRAAAIIRQQLGARSAPGLAAIAATRRLSDLAALQQATRIRALVQRVVGES